MGDSNDIPAELAELKKLFDTLDKDGDSGVDGKEWGIAVSHNWDTLSKYFGGETKAEVGRKFATMDTDGNKKLSWEEVQAAVKAIAENPQKGESGLPDLKDHHSIMANLVKQDDYALYHNLKDLKTSNGITLSSIIAPGVANRGHPMIKSVGALAGDIESYTVFKDLFSPLIKDKHHGFDVLNPQMDSGSYYMHKDFDLSQHMDSIFSEFDADELAK